MNHDAYNVGAPYGYGHNKKNMTHYTPIKDFGNCSYLSGQNNPISYCALPGLASGFLHTLGDANNILGPDNAQVQAFAAQYCAKNWDGVCEYMYQDTNRAYPNTVQACNSFVGGSCMGPGIGSAQTKGQVLLRNACAERFLVKMSANCYREYQHFDPTDPNSPLISRWKSNCAKACIPIYDVNPLEIDNDHVMNRVLTQPWIAIDILENIYNNRKREGRLEELKNTKLYKFFNSKLFMDIINSQKCKK